MKKVALLTTILVSSIILAGCGPQVDQPGVITGQKTTSSTSGQDLAFNNTTRETTPAQPTQPQKQPTTQKGGMKTLADFEKIAATQVTLTTTKGDITFDIYTDKVPLTAANFLNLAKSGYYDGIVFHRVIPDFMAQVGDPQTKEAGTEDRWGMGGPGYTIADEFDPSLKHDAAGVVSMANAGPNTGGSQFFITYEATPWLDGKHAVFGKVTAGLDVLQKIEIGDKIVTVSYK